MTARSARWRRSIARAALVLGGVFVVWLPAGILDVVPFVLELPGEASIRVHAAAVVACLMVAAWGFWNE